MLIRLRDLCRELGVALPDLRALAESDPTFPPIEWTGKRSGYVFREDLDRWIAARHDRAKQRREQAERKRAAVKGPKPARRKDRPDWLRGA